MAVVIETIVEHVINADDHLSVEAGLFVGVAGFLAEDFEGWMMDVQ